MTGPGAAIESPNPSLDASAVEAALQREWGISGRVSELVSTQDQNFRVKAADGSQYVLKVSNVGATRRDLEAQDLAMRHLASGSREFAAPEPIETVDGKVLVDLDGHLLRLVTWVEGTPLADLGYLPGPTLVELGRLAGQCAAALADLHDPVLRRQLQWEPSSAPGVVRDLIADVEDQADRALVERAIAPLLGLDTSALPRQTVHCDVTDFNVIAERLPDGRLKPAGIVDFGDVCESWRATEPAHAALSSVFREPGDPLGGVLAVVRGFVESTPLEDAEAAAVWPLILARAAVSALSSVHQASLTGSTPHLTRLIEEDWSVLRAVTEVPLPLAIAAIRLACGHDAGEAGRRARGSVMDAPRTAPVAVEIDDATVLDLSIPSASFHEGDWRSRQGVEAAIGPDRPAIGRWGEVRLTASGSPGDAAPATLHLGVDLFLPVGTEVLAPVAGSVTRVDGRALVIEPAAVQDGTLHLRLAGIEPAVSTGEDLALGAPLGSIGEPGPEEILPPHLHLQLTAAGEMPGMAQAEHREAALAVCPDPSFLLGLDAAAPAPTSAASVLERRSKEVPAAAGTYFEEPPEMVRGWRHHLIDGDGRPYVDSVNNVAVLGHSHPAVAAAATSQLRLLNTNSRFLYSALDAYAERLLAEFPPELDRVLMVNSGSEAVDLALRLARAYTGKEDVIALEGAYHGWTTGVFELCTYPPDVRDWRIGSSERIHIVTQPDPYRGASAEAAPYLASVRDACEAAQRRGGIAAFLSEPLLGNQGGIEPPAGYLAGAYEQVRAAGGVCVADEIQVGLGRSGADFWAFEHEGVVPDIVTVAKGAGNGYPIGAVVCRGEIVDSLASGSFFSSAAGSALSCVVGTAVLDTIAAEGLQANAARMGGLLRDRLEEMAERYELIGAVHGRGLFLGVDLVTDRDTKAPAVAEAEAICERLRRLGSVVQPTGDHSNVLKVKPPLCIDEEAVETLLGGLERVLLEGW